MVTVKNWLIHLHAMSRAVFDPVCGHLEDFFNSNSHEVLKNRAEEMALVTAPIATHFDNEPTSAKAFEILQAAFATAEARFRDLCRDQGLDDLMAILRRAPAQVMGGANWLAYLSLGLVKYTDPSLNTTGGVFVANSKHSMVHAWTTQTLFTADRIATLATAMNEIAGVMRWIGKGARFRPTAMNAMQLEVDSNTSHAVDSYEARRPHGWFRDQGLVARDSGNAGEILVFCLGGMEMQTVLHEPRQDLDLHVNFAPSFFEWSPVLHVLEDYQDAITDLFKVRVDAIAQVLCGLSGNVWHTLIWPIEVDELKSKGEIILHLPPHDGSTNYQERLGFTFRLLRTGYFRFPRKYWIEALAATPTPWATKESQRRELVEEFFNGFAVTPERRAEIDLSVLRPYPLLYQAPSGEFYIDLRGIGDFLRDLIEKAKEWFSSQHGDRFTLNVKTMIEKRAPGVRVVGKKMFVRNEHDRKTECDLIVSAGKKLCVIECKAHAKSSLFFRGDPKVVQQRSSQLTQDYAQADAAAKALRNETRFLDSPAHGTWDVEFCVCTPSQEFIRPVDKFGWLAPDVPRICTPEELIDVLQKTVADK